jgi:hypothetical protein
MSLALYLSRVRSSDLLDGGQTTHRRRVRLVEYIVQYNGIRRYIGPHRLLLARP